MTKLAHLSSVHQALDHRIFYKEARSAARAGYDVSVIAKHSRAEVKDGVHIIPLAKRRNRLARMLLSAFSILRAALAQSADIYQFHDPELIPVGLVLKMLGKCVVYDIHEVTAEQLMLKEWLPGPLRVPLSKAFAAFERFAIPRFDGISVPQIYMKDLFQPYAKRVALTRNFVEIEDLPVQSNTGTKGPLLYAGLMSRPRGFLNMIRAMEKIQSDRRLILAGSCDAKLLAEGEAEPGWSKIDYRAQAPFAEMATLYAKASIGLILYENIGQYHLAQAVKLFEFLSWGIPVIMPDFGEWPAFNAETQCGINVNVAAPVEVAAAIDKLLENPALANEMGKKGREAVCTRFSWSSEVKDLFDMYEKIR